MDWLFAGCPIGILRSWTERERSNRSVAENICSKLEPELQKGMLALLTAVVNHNLPMEETLQIFDQVMKDWRATKIS